ncbi:uncharacterized protein LOC110638946 isoform X4 [Hevea brasiliensis]|uniref:uncharacterized protein LOC110638946 isoform X4 n=1 Tax=Hevea brasiliensis TaxID=3981 RepID=UPI0025D0DF81|nr:uncharacterized protein LOC110638946 isoform X4 [Hevea brasiliensis]
MGKQLVKCFVVDAFTDSAFKGNPAAVCFLEEEKDDKWLQAVAAEFNISETCYLTPINLPDTVNSNPRFHLRWFTPVAEVKLCGHATLAASHILFSNGLVVLPSAKAVTELQPQFDEILNCPGRGIIVSGVAPSGSGFDFYSRFFCPKFGINEDPVCGSAHCALAPYWGKKLGKCDFMAYAASPRSGILNIHLDEQKQRVLLRGKARTVMEGSLLV